MTLSQSLVKVAEMQGVKKPEHKMKTLGKLMGAGALGMAGGTAIGYGAGKLLDYASRAQGGVSKSTLSKIAPFIGGALGVTGALWRAAEREVVDRGR
jgi:hypothetical protein